MILLNFTEYGAHSKYNNNFFSDKMNFKNIKIYWYVSLRYLSLNKNCWFCIQKKIIKI